MPAVVAPEHDHRVVAQAEPLQGVEHAAKLLVHEADAGVVGGHGLSRPLRRRPFLVEQVEVRAQRVTRHRVRGRGRGGEVLGQGHLFGRIEVEEPLGGHQRHVRLVEAHAQEKRLARRRPPLEDLHGLMGVLHVRRPFIGPGLGRRVLFLVVADRAEDVGPGAQRLDPARRRRRQRAVRLPARQIGQHAGVDLLALVDPFLARAPVRRVLVPRHLFVKPALHEVLVEMVDLPQQAYVVAAVAEMLGQRDPIPAQQRGMAEIHGLRRRGIAPQQQRHPGRIADRELAIGPVEADSAAGQPVQVGRPGHRIAVAADPRVQIVHGNEQHVGPACRLRGFRRLRRKRGARVGQE